MSPLWRSRSASARSLVRSTVSIPFSICSMTSPMRSASRAAHEMASAGVSSAEGSRGRGFGGRALAGGGRGRGGIEVAGLRRVVAGGARRKEPLGDTRNRRGKEDERECERDVEEEVEQDDLARRIELQSLDPAFDVPDDRHQEQAADQLEQEIA